VTEWKRVRLDWISTEERRTAVPADLGSEEVFHYSIPTLDETGDGSREDPEEIGSGKLVLSGGEVLISKLNPRKSRVLVAQPHDCPTVASTEFIGLRLSSSLDQRFLCYLLVSERTRQFLDAAVQSVTRSQQRVDPSLLTKMWVILPPLRQQKAIADFLDAETARTDQLISVLQRLARVLAERNVALARRLIFGDSSRFFTHSSELPAGWKAAQLKRLATIRRGRFGHRPRNDPALYGGQYPFVQTGDIASARRVITSYSQSLNDQGLATSALFPAGTLAMAIAANIGDVALLGFDACFPDSVVAFVPRPNIQPSFLYHLLRATKPELLGVATLNTQLNVNTERIGEVVVPLPPREEQDVIVKTIDGAMNIEERGIAAIDRQVALLKERRQALITAAVTGELDVTKGAA
jgi:type I restriction enzyme S subunit